jgi:hypothetical protein
VAHLDTAGATPHDAADVVFPEYVMVFNIKVVSHIRRRLPMMHYDPYQQTHDWEMHYSGIISDATPEKPGRWCLCFIAWLLIELGWSILKRYGELEERKANKPLPDESHDIPSAKVMQSMRPSRNEFSLN